MPVNGATSSLFISASTYTKGRSLGLALSDVKKLTPVTPAEVMAFAIEVSTSSSIEFVIQL
jgi:hypothetical protein